MDEGAPPNGAVRMKRAMWPHKRQTPRVQRPERVAYVRQKPKAGAPPTAEERRHIARVAAMPCLVCGACPVQVHHVSASIHGGRITRSPRHVTPLCFRHHKIEGGPASVESLSHRGFYLRYGLDLLAVADKLWQDSECAFQTNERK